MTNLQRITISAIFALSIPAYLSAGETVGNGTASVWGNATINTTKGVSIWSFDRKVSDTTELKYSGEYFNNVDLSVFPIYGCGEVGKEIHVVDKNGNTLARYYPNPDGSGYKIDNSKYGFAITGKFLNGYIDDDEVFNGRVRFYIQRTNDPDLSEYGKIDNDSPFWSESVCYPFGKSGF